MTRAAKPTPPRSWLAVDFDKDPVGVILGVLADSDVALGKKEIAARLTERGVDADQFDRAWRTTAQERVRFDDNVVYEKQKYRWTATPREISLEERIFRLTRSPDPTTAQKLMDLIRDAMENAAADPVQLAEARRRAADAERRIAELQQRIDELIKAGAATAVAPAPPPPVDAGDGAHAQYERAERRRAARERQARIDAMSTVAELAAEVEELTAKRAAPEVLLQHTRALTDGRGLEAIGRAGQETAYDEGRHEPVGDFPNQGEPVSVIRPGYLWHAPGEAVLISKALVTRAASRMTSKNVTPKNVTPKNVTSKNVTPKGASGR